MEHNELQGEDITASFKVNPSKALEGGTVISNEEVFEETKKTTQQSINNSCEGENPYKEDEYDSCEEADCCRSAKLSPAECFLNKSQRKVFFRAALAITGILIVYGLTKDR